MKRAFLLLAILSFVNLFLFSQNNYGLRFKSKEVLKKDRTGLDLTQNGSISYNTSFEIKFDLSFREYEGFGYIFRLKELKSDNQIDLICKLDEASPGLYLVSNKRETEAKIGFTDFLEHPKNEWNELQAKINADSGIIQLCFKGKRITEQINFPNNSEFVIGFGVVNNYNFDTKEVPYISLRNISILTDNNEHYHWPLSNYSGDISVDTINKKKALIANPEWEIYHHSKWKYLKGIRLKEKTQAVYDSNKEIIYLIGDRNKIYYFDLNQNTFDSIIYKGLPPVYENDNQVIVNHNSELIAYSHQENIKSKFDFETKMWSPQFEKHDSLPKYWHHNKLINPIDSSLISICGYGFYKYNNEIISFNEHLKSWSAIDFKGDTIYPRYLSSLGKNPNNNYQYYLFGGLGNKSGDQILGTEFFYDLYLIDFKDSTIKRKWQFDYTDDNLTPVNSLVVDENGKYLYTLCFSHHDENSHLKILKVSIEDPEYLFIADSIPYYFVDTWSYADLYYWTSARKLVAITLSNLDEKNFDVKLYSLQFPPGSIEDAKKNDKSKKWFSAKTLVVFALILLLVIGIIIIRKRQVYKQNKLIKNKSEESDKVLTKRIKAAPNKSSSINLFGGFQVFDKKGKDITYRFSPTLKELFLLMLLHSFKSSKGISSLKIQEILWPDKSPSSAKNNRGVNIKKLRTVLPDIGSIQIMYESPYWKLELDEGVFCDYYFVNKFLSDQPEQNMIDASNYFNLLGFLKRGNMLTNIETEWLDKFKGEMSTKIVQFLERKLQNTDIKEDTIYILETVDIITQFDQLNETALSYKCKVLNCLGEHGLAMNTYNNYIKLYQKVYGEEYKILFKQVIKA